MGSFLRLSTCIGTLVGYLRMLWINTTEEALEFHEKGSCEGEETHPKVPMTRVDMC